MSQTLTPEQCLEAASRAWQNALSAEYEISRLKRYRKMNAGMEADHVRHCQRLADARLELGRLLNTASIPTAPVVDAAAKTIPYTTPAKFTGD